MRKARRGGREILGIVLLFGVFLAFALYSERVAQETTGAQVPSMYNAQAGGVKALNLLLERQGFAVADLRSPWNTLSPKQGLLVVVEPLDRDRGLVAGEIEALSRWVKEGGHLLYLVAAPPRPLDPDDPLTGDLIVTGARSPERAHVVPKDKDADLMQSIKGMKLGGDVRLKPAPNSPYRVLAEDKQGVLAVEKTAGKGKFWAIASTSLATNAGIADADNALLLVNAATLAIGQSGKTVAFDEYHHGLGIAAAGSAGTRSLLAATPLGVKLIVGHFALLAVILIYNGNRFFGRPLPLPAPAHRSSMDYLGGMARLYKRAGATDIALGTIHQAFVRDLTAALMLTLDAPTAEIVERARRRFALDPNSLNALLLTGTAALNGQRMTETEMLRWMEQYELLRRKLDLAGNA